MQIDLDILTNRKNVACIFGPLCALYMYIGILVHPVHCMLVSAVDRAVTSKKRQSQNMSCDVDADEIILIDDDDDDDDADDDAGSHNAACDDVDDDDYVVVETCAADKCRKFVGELVVDFALLCHLEVLRVFSRMKRYIDYKSPVSNVEAGHAKDNMEGGS